MSGGLESDSSAQARPVSYPAELRLYPTLDTVGSRASSDAVNAQSQKVTLCH